MSLDTTGLPPIAPATHTWRWVGKWILVPAEDPPPAAQPAAPAPQLLDESLRYKPQGVKHQTPPPSIAPLPAVSRPAGDDPMDHPLLGGRITVCVLCYGEETRLAQTCLTSLLATVPQNRLDLRIWGNQVCRETREFIQGLPVTKFYDSPENVGKYKAMRQMFWDEERPILTSHVVWLDDDTRIVDGHWLTKLSRLIIGGHGRGTRMYGWKHLHQLTKYIRPGFDPRDWFTQAPWHRGLPFRNRSGAPAPNGDTIHFVVGWAWAIATEAIRACDIPDRRLGHNGDICLGEQIYQGGFKIAEFNANKSLIFTPPKSRRGYVETFPWSSPEGSVPIRR